MSYPAFPKLARLYRDIVVTEKLDGTNAQVFVEELGPDIRHYNSEPDGCAYASQDGRIYSLRAGSRNRWLTLNSDNYGFCAWVHQNARELLKLGPGSHFGEWWGQGIQRGYGLTEKRFSLFNTARWTDDSVRPACCHVVPVLYEGEFGEWPISYQLTRLARGGSVAAPGFTSPEGVVIYHKAANVMFKYTLDGDGHKGAQ